MATPKIVSKKLIKINYLFILKDLINNNINIFNENHLIKCLLKIKSKKIKKTLINKGNLRIKSLVKENFRGHNLILKKIGSLQNSKSN